MAKKSKKKTKKKPIKKPISGAIWFFMVLAIVVMVSVSVLGLFEYLDREEYVETDIIRVDGDVITLGKDCKVIVAQTSPERARSIQLGLEGKIDIRPNTHDIFADTLEKFDITLEAVTLDRFEEGIYYANLHLRKGNIILKMDSKPSDGIALALRTKSPIYVKKEMLEEIGKDIC